MTETPSFVCPLCKRIAPSTGHWCVPPSRQDTESRTDSKPDPARPRTDRFG